VVRCFPADDEECRCECVERLNHLISPKIGESVDGRWNIQLQLCTQITPKAAVATKFRIDDSDPTDQSRTLAPPSPSFLLQPSNSIKLRLEILDLSLASNNSKSVSKYVLSRDCPLYTFPTSRPKTRSADQIFLKELLQFQRIKTEYPKFLKVVVKSSQKSRRGRASPVESRGTT
jgi:hypothetical protein